MALATAHVSVQAFTITNVLPVNVTPSSFTILWRTLDSTPAISVSTDPQGTTNLAGQLGIEAFPLHTGNPELLNPYDRRQNKNSLRQKTRRLGLMQMRVTGCQPDTTYYYRLTSTITNSGTATYPESGPLPSVTTAVENSFVSNSQQVLIEVLGLDSEGRIVTLTHSNAAYALSAVVGDGAGTNQAHLNLSDLFALVGGRNFMPLGSQEFALTLLGPERTNIVQQFTFNFTADFVVAQSTYDSFGIEFLALALGSTILRTGQTGSVPMFLNGNVALTEITANLQIATDRLTDLSLLNLPPAIQTATITPQSPTNALLHLQTAPGQTFQGSMQLGELRFRAATNQSSAFVPLRWMTLNVVRSSNLPLPYLLAQSGRVVVIGREPLLEAALQPGGQRRLVLYGNPFSSYAIQSSSDLNNSANWAFMTRIPLTNLFHNFDELGGSATVFYRAMELQPDPPLLEAHLSSDQGRFLLAYGRPGSQYTLQYSTNLSGVVAWYPLLDYTLTNSFTYIQGIPTTNPVIFLRLRRN